MLTRLAIIWSLIVANCDLQVTLVETIDIASQINYYRVYHTTKSLQLVTFDRSCKNSTHKHEEETYLRAGHERWQTSRLRTENPTETSPLLLKTSTLSHWNSLSVLFWPWTLRYHRLRPSKASPNVLKLLHKRPFPPKRSSHWLQLGCVSTISVLSSVSCSV